MKLFITPLELVSSTELGGNIDPDRYISDIGYVMEYVVEPLLGTELYDKIYDDFVNDTLTGDYEILFNKFIKDITIYSSAAEYLNFGSVLIENGGNYRHSADDREAVTDSAESRLREKYAHRSQAVMQRFEKWICKNPLPEYKTYQDEVNAQKVITRGGWYFGGDKGCNC